MNSALPLLQEHKKRNKQGVLQKIRYCKEIWAHWRTGTLLWCFNMLWCFNIFNRETQFHMEMLRQHMAASENMMRRTSITSLFLKQAKEVTYHLSEHRIRSSLYKAANHFAESQIFFFFAFVTKCLFSKWFIFPFFLPVNPDFTLVKNACRFPFLI